MFPLRLCGGEPLVALTRERRYGPNRLRVNDDDDDDDDAAGSIRACCLAVQRSTHDSKRRGFESRPDWLRTLQRTRPLSSEHVRISNGGTVHSGASSPTAPVQCGLVV